MTQTSGQASDFEPAYASMRTLVINKVYKVPTITIDLLLLLLSLLLRPKVRFGSVPYGFARKNAPCTGAEKIDTNLGVRGSKLGTQIGILRIWIFQIGKHSQLVILHPDLVFEFQSGNRNSGTLKNASSITGFKFHIRIGSLSIPIGFLG
jgi:hypothetical protein